MANRASSMWGLKGPIRGGGALHFVPPQPRTPRFSPSADLRQRLAKVALIWQCGNPGARSASATGPSRTRSATNASPWPRPPRPRGLRETMPERQPDRAFRRSRRVVTHSPSGQSLIEIGDDVGRVFQPDRQPHNVGAGTGGYALFVGELAMRGGRRVDDQATHVADVGQVREELHAGYELYTRLVAAFKAKGKHR